MKTKISLVFLSLIVLLGMTASVVKAEIKVNVTSKVDVSAGVNATSTATTTTSVRGNATSTAAKNNKATSTDTTTKGSLTALEHRSTVASFVKSLNSVADRDGGIGAEVRVVAQAQNESASTTENAIRKIDNRGGFKKFFIGGDYKSLGQLRSEMVTTENNIDKLNKLAEKTTNQTTKAELLAQVKVLEDSQLKVEAYIEANKGSFSVFGWIIKPFVK